VEESCCLKNLANKYLLIACLALTLSLKSWAQTTSLQQAELTSINGLHSDFIRQSRIDSKGAVWVCQNNGLQVFPSSDSASQHIESYMTNIPVWDVAFYQQNQQTYTAIISFDSGLYIFNHLGQLAKRVRLQKTRVLQWVDKDIYCLSGNGVFKLAGTDTIRATPACAFNEQISAFFSWNEQFYACTYPTNRWIQWPKNGSGKNGQWNKQAPWPIQKSILSTKATESHLYLGSEGSYYSIDKGNLATRYNLNKDKGNNWTVWSIENTSGPIFLALGDVNNLSKGALLKHQPNQVHPSIANTNETPFLWGLSYDSIHHVLWISSIGQGCFTLFHPGDREETPKGHIHFEPNTERIFIWQDQSLYTRSSLHQFWHKQVFTENILDVKTNANQTFALTSSWLYKWNESLQRFQRHTNMAGYRANELIPAGYHMILKWPYREWTSINLNTGKIETWPMSSKKTAQFIIAEGLVIAQEFDGSIYSVNPKDQTSSFLGKFGFTASTPMTIFNNLLLAQTGQTCKVFQFYLGKMQFLTEIDIHEFVLPGQSFKIFSNSRGFWVLTNTHLYQLVIQQNGNIRIAAQQFIGHLQSQTIQNAVLNDTRIWYRNAENWVSMPLPKQNPFYPQTNYFLKHQDGQENNLNNVHLAIQSLNDINIHYTHPEYWSHYHGILWLSLKNEQDSVIQRLVRAGQDGAWLPGISPGNYVLFISHNMNTKGLLLTSKSRLGLPSIAVMLILIVMTALIHFRDQTKSVENQITLLKWKTLKSNMNPHFLHNSMSLIQSLIITNEHKKAIEVTGKIAEINRLFLETNLQELTTLDKEIEFCRKYIQIETLRFSNRKFSFIEQIDPNVELSHWKLPPLLFQPVIENAIKHGLLLDPNKGKLLLGISWVQSSNSLQIQIANTGPGPQFKRTHGTQMGSELVQQRLEHFNQRFEGTYYAQALSGFDAQQSNLYVFTLTLQRIG
jgi:hypothetical protein